MKKILIALALLVGFGMVNQTYAQKAKVLEHQPKKKPAWVNTLVKDYIIVVASSNTLEDAQEKALIKVKEHIISSVADNISSTSEYTLTEDTKSGDMSITENYKVATKTRAADIPFIKGISVNQVEEYYWEKVSEKGKITFYYHMKYPFTEFQLKKLIMEYERADRELTQQLEGLLARIDDAESIEELNQLSTEIKALSKSFIDVDNRKTKCNVAVSKISQMIKNVSIEAVGTSLGEIRFSLYTSGRIIKTSTTPKVKSNCAKINDIKPDGNEWVVRYSVDECYDDPDNKITVRCGNASKDFWFNVKENSVEIFVNSDINLTGGTDNGETIEGCNCFIPVVSKYDSPFVIEKVVLNFGNESPIIIENIGQRFSGKGNHDLNLTISKQLDKSVYSQKKYPMVKGTIFYKAVSSNENNAYRIYNNRITTEW
ncbi:MAG: hypothetical protein J6X32_10395 [Salinivirgaceae bacterium]|nr:hypothetical protein [Salinivirgaceae bacterium]